MGPLLAEVGVLGLVSGLDPLAFIAVLVVSAQRRRNGLAFVAGWVLVLSVLSLAPATFLHSGGGTRREVSHRELRTWIVLAAGVVLVALAVRAWQIGRRHDPNEVPRWYQRLQRVGPKTSFATGCVLPSFPAAVAAGAAIFHADLTRGGQFVLWSAFLTVSSMIVIVPASLLYVSPKAAPRLAKLNDWAFLRRHMITFVVLGAIGLFLVVRSIVRLTRGI